MKAHCEKIDSKFRVVEKATKQVLKEGLEASQAKKLVAFLNQGGAFNGETPAFFLNKKK